MRITWTTALLGLLLFALPAHAVDALRIAVTSFKAKGGIEQNQLDVLCDMVANEIRSTRLYEVVSKSDIESLLDHEQQKQLVGCDDAETSCLAEIGGALGVDFLVTGNVGAFGGVFAVNLKLIDTRRVRTHSSVFRKVEGGERALLDDLPHAVRELLGLATAPTVAATPAPGSQAPLPVPHRAAERELINLGFNEDQVTRLRDRKVLLDFDVPRLAARLLERGYTPRDVERFLSAHGLLDKPLEDRETYVIFFTANLDDRHWRRFKRSRMKLTEYYNDTQESGALEAFKWIGLGLGTPLLIGGAMGLAGTIPSEDGARDAQIGVTALGVGLVITFAVLLAVDLLDLGYLPDGFLETATKAEILQQVPDAGAKFEVLSSLQLVPWGDRTSTGLSLGLTF